MSRVVLGIGEAFNAPACYALITLYFPHSRRATANGIYSTGTYLGSALSSLCIALAVLFGELPWSCGSKSIKPRVRILHEWLDSISAMGVRSGVNAPLFFTEPSRGCFFRDRPLSPVRWRSLQDKITVLSSVSGCGALCFFRGSRGKDSST